MHAVSTTHFLRQGLRRGHQLGTRLYAPNLRHVALVRHRLRFDKNIMQHETQIRLARAMVGQGQRGGVPCSLSRLQHGVQRFF